LSAAPSSSMNQVSSLLMLRTAAGFLKASPHLLQRRQTIVPTLVLYLLTEPCLNYIPAFKWPQLLCLARFLVRNIWTSLQHNISLCLPLHKPLVGPLVQMIFSNLTKSVRENRFLSLTRTSPNRIRSFVLRRSLMDRMAFNMRYSLNLCPSVM